MNLQNKLDKSEVIQFLQKRKIFHGYELIDNLNCPKIRLNLAVPKMLLRSISQFTRKPMNNLEIQDAVNFCDSLQKNLIQGISHYAFKKFRDNNNLSFFGWAQYELLEYYIRCIKN